MLFPFFRHRPASLTPLLILALGVLTAIGPVAIDFYLPAFPAIASDLGSDDHHIQFTLTAFMVGMGVGQLVIGPLSDRFGRWWPMLAGMVLSGLAGLGIVFTSSVGVMIALRLVQGISSSAGAVLARAIARDLSSGAKAARVFSLLMMVTGIAPVAAPILGGLVLSWSSWRTIFVLMTVFAAVTVVLIVLLVPESLPASKRVPSFLGAFRNLAPLLKNGVFLGYTGVLVATFGMLFSFISGSSFVLQEGYGLSASQYSLAFAINSGGILVASWLNSRLVSRFSPARIVAAVVTVQVAAVSTLFVLSLVGWMPLWLFQLLVLLACMSMSPVAANSTALALSSVSEGIGMASALMGALQFTVAGLVTYLVAIGGSVTLTSLTLVMFVSSLVAGGVFLATRRASV